MSVMMTNTVVDNFGIDDQVSLWIVDQVEDFAIWSVQIEADVEGFTGESDAEVRVAGCGGASCRVV